MRRAIAVVTVTLTALSSTTALAQRGRKPKPAPAPAPVVRPHGNTGKLAIEIAVAGADVTIDGVTVARTPVDKPLSLAPGTHSLKVSKPGYAEFLDVVKIKANETTTVTVDLLPFAAAVTVESNPPGADVTIDTKPVGPTPYSGEVDAGTHVIRVSLDGYTDSEKSVQLVAGETYRFSFPLLALAKPVVIHHGHKQPVYGRWWFWAAAGGVVVGTTIAIVAASAGSDPFAGADRVITPSW